MLSHDADLAEPAWRVLEPARRLFLLRDLRSVAAGADLADAAGRLASLGQMKAEEKARLLRELREIRSEAEGVLPQAGRHAPRVSAVAEEAQAMVEKIISSF